MVERIGVISKFLTHGRRLLTVGDGTVELVDADISHDELALRYDLDRIVVAEPFVLCRPAVHLDGPFAGTTNE